MLSKIAKVYQFINVKNNKCDIDSLKFLDDKST